jgi:hypothetical protein
MIMARPFSPKVVTANDLLDGDVIYMDRQGAWTRDLHRAALFQDEPSATTALNRAESEAVMAVGVYLADAKPGTQGPEPVHFREDFRRRGPSNYAHGKQAERAHV